MIKILHKMEYKLDSIKDQRAVIMKLSSLESKTSNKNNIKLLDLKYWIKFHTTMVS